MGHKPYAKKSTPSIFQSRFPLSEEEIEDMKHIYIINGVPILALNEKIANEIYMRNYNKPKEE